MKNTIIIYSDYEGVNFFVLDGDQTHFDGVFINAYDDATAELQDELGMIVYNSNGECIVDMLESFPHDQYIPGETAVIVAGFIP